MPRRAQREPDAKLTLARTGPSQEQVGGVAAHSDKHQQHERLEQAEGRADHALRSPRRARKRKHLRSEGLVGVRIRGGQITHRGVELALSGSGGRLRPEASHDRVASLRPFLELARAFHHHTGHGGRQPHIEGQTERRPLKPPRRDPDHIERLAIDADRRANRRCGASESRLPVVIGDHHDWLSAGRGHVLERQQPASGRMKPQGREVVAGYEQTRGALHPRFLADRQRRHAKGQEPLERGHPLLDVAVLEPGGSDVRAVVGARLDGLKCRRRRDTRQRFPPHHLQPREHDGVHANADRQRHDHHRRHERHRGERSPRVHDVLSHGRPWIDSASDAIHDPPKT